MPLGVASAPIQRSPANQTVKRPLAPSNNTDAPQSPLGPVGGTPRPRSPYLMPPTAQGLPPDARPNTGAYRPAQGLPPDARPYTGAYRPAQDPFQNWMQSQDLINAADDRRRGNELATNTGIAAEQGNFNIRSLNTDAQFDSRYLQNDVSRLNSDWRMHGATTANLGAQRGLGNQRYLNQIDANNKQSQTNFDAQALSRTAATQTLGRSSRLNTTDATGRGAMMSQGFGQVDDEIRGTRDLSFRQGDLTRKAADDNVFASNQANQLGFDRDEQAYTYGMQQQDRQKDYLDALGKDYNVKGAQIQESLRRGIEKIGMDYASTIKQLTDLKARGDADSLAQAQALSLQLIGFGGGAGAPSGSPAQFAAASGKLNAIPASQPASQPVSRLAPGQSPGRAGGQAPPAPSSAAGNGVVPFSPSVIARLGANASTKAAPNRGTRKVI